MCEIEEVTAIYGGVKTTLEASKRTWRECCDQKVGAVDDLWLAEVPGLIHMFYRLLYKHYTAFAFYVQVSLHTHTVCLPENPQLRRIIKET